MDIRRTTLVGAILVLTALLGACATTKPDPSPTPSAVLADTEWVLISLNGNALVEGREITLNFEEASLDGSAGCNTYGGSYTASEDSLRLSDLFATEMACLEPEGIMDQEQAYLKALNAAANFRVEGERLEVYDETGATILAFVAATSGALGAETPTPSQPATVLVDSEWVLISLDGNALVEGREITLNFEETSLDGSAGCNTYGGSYTASEDSLRLSDVYATEMACLEPAGIMDQEQAYLSALNAAARFQVDGDRLEVYDEAGATILAFVAVTTVSEVPTTSITPEARESDLTAKIDVPTSLDSGVIVKAVFTFTNTSSDGFYVLKWFTPLEGIAGDIFRVERDGAELPYRGKLVKRGAPKSEDYMWIEAGESVSAQVDLAEGYDFSQAGQYTIQFRSPRISQIAKTETEKADSFEELGMIQIPSNTAKVVISPVPSTAPPTPTTEVTPLASSPVIEPPAGFRAYQDAVAGVAIYVPESWVVTGVVPGQLAILQSFPEDKYVGGEALQPGDTKCDLNIRPAGTRAADLIQQWKSDPDATIVSEGEVVLQSGQLGTRMEMENMGHSLSLISDVNNRAVVLICFGEFEPFDAIAVTVGANE